MIGLFGEYLVSIENEMGRITVPSAIRKIYSGRYLVEEGGEGIIRIYFPDIMDINKYYNMDPTDTERLDFFAGKKIIFFDNKGRINIDSLKGKRLTEILGEIKPNDSIQATLLANGDHVVIYESEIRIAEKDNNLIKKNDSR